MCLSYFLEIFTSFTFLQEHQLYINYLNFPLTSLVMFLVLKEYVVVANIKPSFADFTQVHVHKVIVLQYTPK